MFTRKERALFRDPYFRVIREEEQFVELQSENTKHCWNVFKNQFEQSRKVKIYHKHKESDKYYHDHKLCRTVAEAVEQIKSHDQYVQEQAAAKDKISVPEKASRHLKVYETSGNNKPTPTIVLKGEWLKNWGFDTGDKLNIVCESNGKLSISLAEE